MDLMLYLGLLPRKPSCFTYLIESTTNFPKNSGSALINLLLMEVFAQFNSASSPNLSTFTASLFSM